MNNSKTLYQRAIQSIPGGVNSPVRAFNGVGGEPLFIKSANGAYIEDADGKQYIDYVASWGPMIAGHSNPYILDAVVKKAGQGLSFGAPTEIEIELAEKIKSFMPAIKKVRMVSSGTEATMSALRLARGYTKRNKIIKFAGCYHGHADSLLVQAGSGSLTLGIPSSAGVLADTAAHTLIAEFNRIETVQDLFDKHPDDIAAVIVEPIPGNMNCILPVNDFLLKLQNLCEENGAVFIVDEVMTGFRVALGGATELYNLNPGLITLGKVIGGGMPVGAFGGREEIMNCIAPLGPVYQAGTLSGNPVAMAAGLACLELISAENFYSDLNQQTEKLVAGINQLAKDSGIPVTTNSTCGMFGIFFTSADKVETFQDVKNCDIERFKKFFHLLLEEGVYLAPSAYEAGFVSSAHTDKEIELTLEAMQRVFAKL